MRPVRIDRLLANLGYGSRREVQALLARGAVELDGETVRAHERKITTGEDLPCRLTVLGEPVDPASPFTLIMHKPRGVVCSHRESGRSVYELLPARWRGRTPPLSTVGRLDADTTGLLLITDDGEFLHRVISPRHHVPKRYLIYLEAPLTGRESAVFASGQLRLPGDSEPLLPAVLEPISASMAWITIGEGRHHQVRRMFVAVGNHVVGLHRDRIGGLDLPADLAAGDFRALTTHEAAAVFAASSR